MPKAMLDHFDVAIIGGGIIGASVFYHLVEANYRVVLLEKNTMASGCTTSSAGIVRCFHLDSVQSDRAHYGFEYYKNFKKHTGVDCTFHQSGFLYIPKAASFDLAHTEVKRLAKRIEIKCLDTYVLKNQYGQLFKQLPQYAIYEPNAGYLCAKTVTKAWVEAGLFQGGTIYENIKLNNIVEKNQKLQLETNKETIITDKVVIATGSSSPHMIQQLGLPHRLTIKNIHMDLMKPKTSITFPAFVDEETNLYGRPDLISGEIYLGLPVNLNKQHSEEIYQTGLKRFTWVQESHLKTSFVDQDSYTKKGRGQVTALNKAKTIFLTSGFSGGGFKMAPWVGSQLVKLIKKSEKADER